MAEPSQTAVPAPIPEELGECAAALFAILAESDLIFLAKNDDRAAEIARILRAGAPDALVLACPGSDALPGESAPASPANAGQRAAALRSLRAALREGSSARKALISSGEAAARLLPHPDRFEGAPPRIRRDEPADLERLAADLQAIGYVTDDRVDEPGEVALRGQVIDVFPADSGQPYRIEVQDGTITSIRAYDPVTQLANGEECDRLELGRASEPELGDGVALLDHLPGAAVAFDAGAEKRRTRFITLAEDVARRSPRRTLRDICGEERWAQALASHPIAAPSGEADAPPPRFVEARNPMRAFKTAAHKARDAGERILLLGTARDLRFLTPRAEAALDVSAIELGSWYQAAAQPPGSLLTLEMPVPRGFRHKGVLAIAAGDLLGSRAQRDEDRLTPADADLFRLGEIKMGDVVVHEDHGVAVVAGIEALPTGGDAIVLRFAGEARRLVPVAQANRIWRYGAEEQAVTLDKLDGSSWAKRKSEVDAAVAETADALVAHATERLTRTAPVLEPEPAAYERFSAGFPFMETADQARAIEAVRHDLASGKPMDRLVIGDVGYGKTEVALRAAALAALAGKQVAVAAPTTVLARQHLETFTERFAASGVTVAGLSRLSTAAEKKAVREGLRDGSIGIVVGTGAVAGKAVEYRDLALVVVDEEQRFGAADKNRLRELGAGHLLTLSATPIPRTLQNALIGLQQLSVIATPPARRQPIRTSVAAFDETVARAALLREHSRGGQSFVVVPRIEDMAPLSARLRKIVPDLELIEAHGKMPAGEIDVAMVRFGRGEGDILLATNIIEAGLDVPRANTMLVWRADRFGLSQLHQLRGRVGRGARRGQIYLFTEDGAEIAPRTLARLNTLQAFDRLGAGFAISARDLDLRGAGDLLGEEQAGHLKTIGIDLYQHLLERAVAAARGRAAEEWSPTLNLGDEGRLPESWVADPDIRIGLYARFARIEALPQLERFEEELADRFGQPPEEARTLLQRARLAILARSAGIERVDAGPGAIALTPRAGVAIDADKYGLTAKESRLLLPGDFKDEPERLGAVESLLGDLDTDSS